MLDLGVDIVVNSATKYLNGHSDLIAGTVSGSRKLIDSHLATTPKKWRFIRSTCLFFTRKESKNFCFKNENS